ncbi:MAG: glutamate 5-kinase, partial [Deltaproteobacteria bacterium]
MSSENQLAHKTRLLRHVRRAVVKVGSNVLSGPQGLRRERVRALAGEIAALVARGRQLVVVTSGAVATGAPRLGARRHRLEWRQAAAAVGQIGLMTAYERAFAAHERIVAQVLLTHTDLSDRRRYLNARHTLRTLLDLGVVPIVNENDTVAVEELKFGDNDHLSALTA